MMRTRRLGGAYGSRLSPLRASSLRRARSLAPHTHTSRFAVYLTVLNKPTSTRSMNPRRAHDHDRPTSRLFARQTPRRRRARRPRARAHAATAPSVRPRNTQPPKPSIYCIYHTFHMTSTPSLDPTSDPIDRSTASGGIVLISREPYTTHRSRAYLSRVHRSHRRRTAPTFTDGQAPRTLNKVTHTI